MAKGDVAVIGAGIIGCAATARLTAEWIADDAPSLDPKPFDAARFTAVRRRP